MAEIDFDRLADGYRMRPMSIQSRERSVTSARGCAGWLLDVGGGVGGHAAEWTGSEQYPVVVDPSSGMLDRASVHSGVALVRATSQELPFRDNSCGLAYFHLSIHFGDWRAAIHESMRVVSPSGRIEVWTIDPASIAGSSLARWFPSVVAIDTVRFPDPNDISQYCSARGASVRVSISTESITRRAADWQDAVRSRFVSTLQLVPDEEIEAGLGRFSAVYQDPDSAYTYDLEMTRISIVSHPLR